MQPIEVARLRDAVDAVNAQIVALLATRQRLTGEIGRHKANAGMPVHIPEREQEMFLRLRERASRHGLDWGTTEPVFTAIVAASRAHQREIAPARAVS